LQHLEHIFQVVHPKLKRDFPPLRTLSPSRSNLPYQLTSFIGRDKELAKLVNLLGTARHVTLTGTGGCGKTRLALQAAAEVHGSFADGVWLVELASLTDPELVFTSIASVLGLGEEPGIEIFTTIVNSLREKSVLLILDNCEHLVDTAAHAAESLLRACKGVSILSTSREALRIPGEYVLLVLPLSCPEESTNSSLPTAKGDAIISDSEKMFIERAIEANPDFSLTQSSRVSIGGICRRLDGIPLAIELAAARVRVLTPEEISARLDERFSLLTAGRRTAAHRHQTLRNAIDWSFMLLTESERTLFRSLSVFTGGWSLEAAEVICGDTTNRGELLNSLGGLVEKSLVLAHSTDKTIRYRLLETVKEYGLQALREHGDEERYRRQHAEYFLELAEEAVAHYSDDLQKEWLDRLQIEHGNLRAALQCFKEDSKADEKAMLLAGALARFWHIRGFLSEGRRHLEAVLSMNRQEAKSRGWATANNGAGILAWAQGDLESANQRFTKTIESWMSLGDTRGLAAALSNLSLVAIDQKDYETANRLLQESLSIRTEMNDPYGIAVCLNNLGNLAYFQCDYQTAANYYRRSLTQREPLGDPDGVAMCLNNLAEATARDGDLSSAIDLFEKSLEAFEQVDDIEGQFTVLRNLAEIAVSRRNLDHSRELCAKAEVLLSEGIPVWCREALLVCRGDIALSEEEYSESEIHYQKAIAWSNHHNSHRCTARALEGLAEIAAFREDMLRAATIMGAATAIRKTSQGAPRAYASTGFADLTARIVESIGRREFDKRFSVGGSMPVEQAVILALNKTIASR
jgi:predicted ATPase